MDPHYRKSQVAKRKANTSYVSSFTPRQFREGCAVAQLVEALRYKPEGRGFDFRLLSYQHCKGKKGNFFPVHSMIAFMWCRGIAPLILNLGSR
jgi:hypothetical protein